MHRSNSDSRRDRQRFSFKNRMKPNSLQDVVQFRVYLILFIELDMNRFHFLMKIH